MTHAQLLLKLLVSILVPIVLGLVKAPTTFAERLLIGVIVFVGWTALETLQISKELQKREKRERAAWAIAHRFDEIIHNIRHHLGEAIKDFYGENDLFQDHLCHLAEELARVVRQAAEKKELFVMNYHFRSTDLVLSAFDGDTAKTLRYVWILDDPLLDDMWRHYMKQVDQMVKQRSLRKVKALLVYTNRDMLLMDEVKELLGFYAHSGGYEYRLIDSASYARLRKDDNLEADYVDFGIYGQRYVYLTLSYGEETRGVFTKHPATISRYTRFFDSAWKSPAALEIDKNELRRVDVSKICRGQG